MSSDKPNKPDASLLPEPVVEREQETTKNTSVIERRLVTILSADVAGYSKLMAEHEEHTLKVFRQHKKVFEQIIELHRGRIFNTAGDAILAEFSSAVEGVRCATEIQSALATKNDQLPEGKKVLFRIGVNLGDVIVQGTDLLGDGVNLAARVQTSADPGGVCISGAIWDQVQNKLSLNVNPLGEVSYKNIPHPVRTFSVHIDKGEKSGFIPAGQARVQRSRFQGAAFLVASAAVFIVAAVTLYFLVKGRLSQTPGTAVAVKSGVGNEALSVENPKGEPASRAGPTSHGESAINAAKEAVNAPEPAGAVLMYHLAKPVFQRPWREPSSKNAGRWVVAAGQSSGNARPTIREAVAASSPGDVIEIRPGIYKENIVIDKDLVLRGMPGEDKNVAVTVEWEGLDVLHFVSGKVTVENMHFVVVSNDTVKPASALLLNGADVKLFNVAAFATGASGSSGVSVRSGKAEINASEFRGVRGIEHLGGKFECTGCVAAGASEEGIMVMNQGNEPGFKSHFSKCSALNAANIGIAVMSETTASFEDCEALENGVNGVQLQGTSKVKFTGGEVRGNKGLGFLLNEQSFAEVKKTKVIQNGLSGFAATGTAIIEIRDSEISANGEFGIALLNEAQSKENGNKILGNRSGGSFRAPASTQAPVPAK